jgi:hypothetical protein
VPFTLPALMLPLPVLSAPAAGAHRRRGGDAARVGQATPMLPAALRVGWIR